jgi:hypothetical protein
MENFVIVWTIDGETMSIPHPTQDQALTITRKTLDSRARARRCSHLGWKGPGCRRDPEPPTSADSTQKTHPLAGRTLDNCSGAPVVPGLVMGEKHWTKRSKESGRQIQGRAAREMILPPNLSSRDRTPTSEC